MRETQSVDEMQQGGFAGAVFAKEQVNAGAYDSRDTVESGRLLRP